MHNRVNPKENVNFLQIKFQRTLYSHVYTYIIFIIHILTSIHRCMNTYIEREREIVYIHIHILMCINEFTRSIPSGTFSPHKLMMETISRVRLAVTASSGVSTNFVRSSSGNLLFKT